MHPLSTLRSWLGRPLPVPKRPAARLGCEGLEERALPAGLLLQVDKSLPAVPSLNSLSVSPTEVVARTSSANPLGDLSNVVAANGLGSVVDAARSSIVMTSNGVSLLKVILKPGAAVPGVIQTLSASGLYASVTPNYVYPTSRAASSGADLREHTPNDPRFGEQFFQPIIRTPQAWEKTTGSSSVVTAILDDGLDLDHPDLAGNVWTNTGEVAGNGRDDDGNGFVDDLFGYDFVNDSGNVRPDDPAVDVHGTQVAGLIAGKINNGTGGAGVAGTSRVLPLKVVGSGPTTSLTIARAVEYAVKARAKIINCSLNVDPFVEDPTFRAALANAYNAGILWINSEGNGNVQGPPRESLEEMILVGATDRDDKKAGYSNFGPGADLFAPGGEAGGGLLTAHPGGGFGGAAGTSMAAALASGTAALIWSANPGYTRDQVASALLSTAEDLRAKNPGLEDKLGAGRLNAERAVNGPGVTKLGTLTGLPDEGGFVDGLPAGEIRIRTNSNLDPATLNSSNFELRSAGPDGQFGTPDDSGVGLAVANAGSYRVGTNEVILSFGQSLQPGLYRFIARSGGLADPFGRPVDGDGDGSVGGDLIRNFRVGYQVAGRVYEDTRNAGFPSATDPGLGGQTVYADLNGNGSLDRSTHANTGGGFIIPDNEPAGVFVPVVVSGVNRPIGQLGLSVLVFHPRPSDLQFILIAPDGSLIELFRNPALPSDPGQPLHLFVIGDEEDRDTSEAPGLNTHRLPPEIPLDDFDGLTANGIWSLHVIDHTPGDAGEVRSSALTVADEPTAVTAADGSYFLNGLDVGTVRVNVAAGIDFARSADGAAVSVTIGAGGVANADLGLVRPAGVYGRVLVDDGSRSFDTNDVGLRGAVVYLDTDGNGTRTSGEPATTTDANGNYAFGPLLPGTYTVVVIPPAGYVPVTGNPTRLTATVGGSTPVSTGNDFLLMRSDGRATAIVLPVNPSFRTLPVEAVGVSFSEPLPPLNSGHFTLTRNGVEIPLTGVTVLSGATGVTLAGLRNLTTADGVYRLTVFAPAPVGQPSRQPQPAVVEFIVDGTAPTAVASVENRPTDAVRLVFSEQVSGVAIDALRLTRNGGALPLDSARLEQLSPTEYRVSGLAAITAERGVYTLSVVNGNTSVRDAAGNQLGQTATVTFRVGQEPQPVIGRRTVVGAGAGGPATVAVFDTATGRLLRSFQPFEPGFTGGVRVAVADLNGDGTDDILTAAGPGGGPRLMGFDGITGERLLDVLAFEPTFTGGVNVAAGKLDANGRPVLFLTPDMGGGPRVRVMDTTGTTLADFFGIADASFRGGARAAVGDVNGDGDGDLIVSAGMGGGPRIAVYSGLSVLAGTPARVVNDFFAFESSLRNGAFVAAGDIDGDGFAELIFGGGPGGAPRVRAVSGKALVQTSTLVTVADYFAADATDRGGVRVAAKDSDGDGLADVIAGDGNGSGGSARVFFARDVLSEPLAPTVGQLLSAFGGFGDGIYVG